MLMFVDMSQEFFYEGKDLESMSFAENYHRWILKKFEPFLGKRIVEVGAGSGSFATLITELSPEEIVVVEPSLDMHGILKENLKKISKSTKVDFYNDFYRNVAKVVNEKHKPDSYVYVNVFEHIKDDEAELHNLYESLSPGGRIFIFVPALSFLYSEFDRKIDHYRRYTKRELEGKVKGAGFQVLHAQYFDMLGILPWWLKFTIGKSTKMDHSSVKLYDKLGVPVLKVFEGIFEPPIGKNVLLVAEKPR